MSLYAKAIAASTSRVSDDLMASRFEVYFDEFPGKLGVSIAHPEGKLHVLELAKSLRAMAAKLEEMFHPEWAHSTDPKDTRWRVKS